MALSLLTTKQVATELGVCPQRVRDLIRAGRLKASRYGDRYLVRASDVDAVRVRPYGNPKWRKAVANV